MIAAAGSGTRFGGPKQLIEIAAVPMVAWSIFALAAVPEISAITIVTEGENTAALLEIGRAVAGAKFFAVVPGGATRQASVAAGLAALEESCQAVAVHDGARPLILTQDVRAAMEAVQPGRGVTFATPVVDTIKEVDAAARRVVRTLDRSRLWAAQTPQLAMRDDLVRAHDDARLRGREATDDVALLEAIGVEVLVHPASGENFKVTYPADVERARAILALRPRPMRVAPR